VRQIAACDNLPHPSNAATRVALNLQTGIQHFKPGAGEHGFPQFTQREE
jgi:hypothetical protein